MCDGGEVERSWWRLDSMAYSYGTLCLQSVGAHADVDADAVVDDADDDAVVVVDDDDVQHYVHAVHVLDLHMSLMLASDLLLWKLLLFQPTI